MVDACAYDNELSKHKYLYEKFKEIAKKVKEETYG